LLVRPSIRRGVGSSTKLLASEEAFAEQRQKYLLNHAEVKKAGQAMVMAR